MTLATDLARRLASRLGEAEDVIHTALAPMHLGGGADVLTFRRAPSFAGTFYVSAGLSPHQQVELMMVTREPEAWAPPLLSKLAAAALTRRFRPGGTVPLGDASSPLAALAFDSLPDLRSIGPELAGPWLRLVVGITHDELLVCRSHGTAHVLELLRREGVFPFSIPGREPVTSPTDLAPLPLEGLGPGARRGIEAAIHMDDEGVELGRGEYGDADLPQMIAIYERLVAWEQRCYFLLLLSDSLDPRMRSVWSSFVPDALKTEIEEMTNAHWALATALAGLDGDRERFTRYYDDLPHALATAHARVARRDL